MKLNQKMYVYAVVLFAIGFMIGFILTAFVFWEKDYDTSGECMRVAEESINIAQECRIYLSDCADTLKDCVNTLKGERDD